MIGFALAIALFQLFVTPDRIDGHDLDQPQDLFIEIITAAVQHLEQRVDGVKIGTQPSVEMTQVFLANFRFELIQDAVQ
jgi:hypothetical protein